MRILFVIYDNDSQLSDFPLGVAYLISTLRKNGYNDINIYNQDIYHYPEAHLTEFLNDNHYDVIGIGVIGGYYQYRKLLKICESINKSSDRPLVILGGHGPSPEPEFFMRKTHADFTVIGEGEVPLTNLLKEISGPKRFNKVKGIAYWENDKVRINERESLITNLEDIPLPAWDAFPIDAYAPFKPAGASGAVRTMPVLTCRGCMYRCNFCYRMEKGYRLRSTDYIIDEIKKLQKDYRISFIRFRDELLMATEARVIELCEKLIKEKVKLQWDCNGRLNTAKESVLKLMKKTGCVYINYGIESLDQNVLNLMNKHQTINEIVVGIENTIKAGINPGFNILFNNLGDTAESLKKGVDFLLKYNTYSEVRTIKPVTPYPGSDLYYYAIKKGLLDGPEDFYETKHLNSDFVSVNFTDIPDDELNQLLFEANKVLIEDHYSHLADINIEAHRKLYFEKDFSFRGARH
jgi:radical SAM superfamily enzyme YgiQ (UPF0313 family)